MPTGARGGRGCVPPPCMLLECGQLLFDLFELERGIEFFFQAGNFHRRGNEVVPFQAVELCAADAQSVGEGFGVVVLWLVDEQGYPVQVFGRKVLPQAAEAAEECCGVAGIGGGGCFHGYGLVSPGLLSWG